MSAPLGRPRPTGLAPAVLHRLALGLALLLAVLYLLHLGTPLRLSTDTLIYLQAAATLADGLGYAALGGRPMYPVGYPALVAAADLVGLGHAPGLLALNLLALAAGLAAWYRMLRAPLGCTPATALGLCVLTAASYGFVKHAPLMLSDVPFFGVAAVALLALVRFRERPGPVRLGVALAAVGAALLVRSAAVAFVPVLLWLLVQRTPLRGLGRRIRANPLRAAGLAALLLAVLAVLGYTVGAPTYLYDLQRVYGEHGLGGVAWWNVRAKLSNLGEIGLNVPRTIVTAAASELVAEVAAYLAGAVVALLAVRGTIDAPGRASAPALFGYSYVALIVLWPGDDVRFWLPVMPLVLLALLRGAAAVLARYAPRARRTLAGAYAAGFVLLGLAALGYSLSVAYAGPDFGARYGSGTFRGPYDACLLGTPDAPDDDLTDDSRRGAYWLLHRYEGCAALRCPAGPPAATPPATDYHRAEPCP